MPSRMPHDARGRQVDWQYKELRAFAPSDRTHGVVFFTPVEDADLQRFLGANASPGEGAQSLRERSVVHRLELLHSAAVQSSCASIQNLLAPHTGVGKNEPASSAPRRSQLTAARTLEKANFSGGQQGTARFSEGMLCHICNALECLEAEVCWLKLPLPKIRCRENLHHHFVGNSED